MSSSDNFLNLHPIAKGVHGRLVGLAFAWSEFHKLFLSGAERTQVLIRSAGGFFGIVHDALLDSIFLRLASLSDPESNAHQSNLSFPSLIKELTNELAAANLLIGAEMSVASFASAVRGIKQHRHKRIAHGDVAVLATKSSTLDPVTIAELRASVDAAFHIFNATCGALCETGFGFDSTIVPGDADALVSQLQAARRYRELSQWLWTQDPHSHATAESLLMHLRDKLSG